MISPLLVLATLAAYLLLLFIVAYFSGQRVDNEGFFIGNRRTTWYMATLAMIGAAMSGVTFISGPGSVATDGFSYMQMVVGFTIGQLIVAFVLVPTFYRRGVVSLYEYLDSRFGITTHRTGAWCFLFSKVISASLKIYVVCSVMQLLVFDYFHIDFIWNILFTMTLVWLYQYAYPHQFQEPVPIAPFRRIFVTEYPLLHLPIFLIGKYKCQTNLRTIKITVITDNFFDMLCKSFNRNKALLD